MNRLRFAAIAAALFVSACETANPGIATEGQALTFA